MFNMASFKVYVLVLKYRFGVLFTFKPKKTASCHITDNTNVYRDVAEIFEPRKVVVAIWQPGTYNEGLTKTKTLNKQCFKILRINQKCFQVSV